MMIDESRFQKYIYKDVERNSAQLEKLSIDVAVMSKQYDDIHENLNKIIESFERLEERLDKLEKERTEEIAIKKTVKKIISNIFTYWWVWALTLFYFMVNDTKWAENILKSIKGVS